MLRASNQSPAFPRWLRQAVNPIAFEAIPSGSGRNSPLATSYQDSHQPSTLLLPNELPASTLTTGFDSAFASYRTRGKDAKLLLIPSCFQVLLPRGPRQLHCMCLASLGQPDHGLSKIAVGHGTYFRRCGRTPTFSQPCTPRYADALSRQDGLEPPFRSREIYKEAFRCAECLLVGSPPAPPPLGS
ncbi:hypothetical protein L209DRAFT_458351 [Thermothelomyces heterothallicus CBS 203.75]